MFEKARPAQAEPMEGMKSAKASPERVKLSWKILRRGLRNLHTK